MNKQPLLKLFLILTLVTLACSLRPQADPTPMPTDAPTAVPDPVSTTEPAATAEPPAPAGEIDWPPQVVYASPAPGEESLLNGAITIRFDQPMDRDSVEKAFAIESIGGAAPAQKVSGSFSWPRADTVVFTPAAALERQQRYRVEIMESAFGLSGKALTAAIRLEMETVGYLEVSQVIPADGTTNAQVDSAITVLFNRPVVPIVTTAQQDSWPHPLQIEPPVSGRGEWTSSSIYRFIPDEPLDGDAAYSITIAAGLEDVTGGVLEAGHSWSFRTAGPRVISSQPANRASQVDPTQPITLTFNMPMNTAVTQSAVQLQPATAVDYQWSDNDRVLTLIPRQQLRMGQEYRLAVSTSARSANGGAALEQEYAATFNTPAMPAVLSTNPANERTADRYAYGITIRFASPMDMATLEDAIRIQPEPPRRPHYFFSDYDNSLYVNFELTRSAEYVVTVPGTAADPYGNTLGSDYTFRFNTPPHLPLVSLNLPQYISQLTRSHPSDVIVAHRNVSRLDAELHDAGLPITRLLNQYSVNEIAGSGEPLRSWNIPVETALNQVGQTTLSLADGGVLPNGVYLLTVRAPENPRDDRWWQNQINLIIVADTNLLVKEEYGAVHVWATDLATGQPVSGRRLTFFNRNGRQVGGNIFTDNNGFATLADYFPSAVHGEGLNGALVISNEPGENGFGVGASVWNPDATPWRFGLPTAWNDEPERFAYLFTDRPIYRPGDRMHMRGIVRDTNYGRYPLPTRQTATVIVEAFSYYDSNQLILEETVTLDEGGGFTLELVVPEDARLGAYRIAFRDSNLQQAERMFTVAQYRAPEFLVTMSTDTPEMLTDQRPQAALQATYFFGGSASDLEVNWTLYREDYNLPWQGPYFSFRDWRDASRSWNPWLVGDGRDWIASGTGRTDADGRFEIPLAAEMFGDANGRFTVEAGVLDAANRSVTSRVEMIVHAAETYVGVSPANYISQAGTESQVNLITVDWDGQPVANQPVEVVFYQRDWIARREGQFGEYFTQWETVDTEVGRDAVRTDQQGRATAAFTPTVGGSYLAVATVTDSGGRQQTSSSYIWVMSPQFTGWQIDPREMRLNLTPDRAEYRPGDTAEILIQTPYSPGARAWVIIERGVLLEQQVITLDGGSHLLTIPITADHAPNIFVTVVVVKGVDATNQYAEMRLGMTELIVSPEQLQLNLEMTPDRGFYQPGDEVTYDILVTNQQGQPVQADVSVALVDLAVLTLLPDNAPPIGEAFYARQPHRSQIGAGLFFSGEGLELELPDEVGGRGGGGGDGGAEAAVFLDGEEEDETRRDFRDTAHWEGRLTTNANGRAALTISLPDNLTTWRLSAKAVTAQTLVGQDYVDIVSTLPLLIRPVTPRFFTVGDVMLLGALVHNNTDAAIEAAVSLQAFGLTLNGPAEQSVTVAAGGQALIQWPITAEDFPFADLVFRVSGGAYQDATTPTFGVGPNNQIPILRYAGQDWVASSGVLDEAGRRMEGVLLPPEFDNRRGSVTVTVNPSLAAAVLDAMEVINRPRYHGTRCAQSILDQMLPNVAIARALAQLGLDNPDMAAELARLINRDLGELQRSQRSTGGWGWCHNSPDDPVTSAYALLTLVKAREAGYEVSDNMISRGQRYIGNQLADMERLTQRYDANRAAFFAYALAESGGLETAALDELFSDYRNLLDPYAKGLMVLAYHKAAPQSPNVAALLSDLNNSAVVSATGAHWEDETRDWRNWNSDTRGTAIIIAALSAVEPDHPFAAPAVSWLMTARTAELWPSSHDTAWSLLALTDWMAATGELNANYGYSIALNASAWQEGRFTRDNLTETDAYTIGLDNLLANEVNFFDIERGGGDGRLYYNLHLTSHAAAHLEAMNRGFIVQRAYYDADCNPERETCEPITSIEAGRQIRVELTVILPHNRYYVTVEDYFPAGAEALDPSLESTPSNLGDSMRVTERSYHYGFWGWWLFNQIEYRDDRVVFSSNYLPAGTYQYSYILQAIMPGDYQVAPTTARQEFMPEVFGRAAGMLFVIEE